MATRDHLRQEQPSQMDHGAAIDLNHLQESVGFHHGNFAVLAEAGQLVVAQLGMRVPERRRVGVLVDVGLPALVVDDQVVRAPVDALHAYVALAPVCSQFGE